MHLDMCLQPAGVLQLRRSPILSALFKSKFKTIRCASFNIKDSPVIERVHHIPYDLKSTHALHECFSWDSKESRVRLILTLFYVVTVSHAQSSARILRRVGKCKDPAAVTRRHSNLSTRDPRKVWRAAPYMYSKRQNEIYHSRKNKTPPPAYISQVPYCFHHTPIWSWWYKI